VSSRPTASTSFDAKALANASARSRAAAVAAETGAVVAAATLGVGALVAAVEGDGEAPAGELHAASSAIKARSHTAALMMSDILVLSETAHVTDR
jgi:hypothetical protein